MSTLYVDTITEKTSGNGVQIPGHVVQVVSSTYSTAGSTTSASPIQMWSGLSITPKFANSIIKVECNWFAVHHDYYDGFIQIYRNGSALSATRKVVRNAAHTGGTFVGGGSRNFWYCPAWLWSFTEAAGGTSQITYSLYGWTGNAGYQLEWNQASANANETPTSTLTLMEIAQ